jgi:Tol biopolymer transport system component
MRVFRPVLAIAGLAAVTAALHAPSAGGTMPGRNGDLAFWIADIDDLLGYYVEGLYVGLVSPNGTNRRFIARGLDPAFSPSGHTLAISAERPWGIVLRRLDGRRIRRLTTSNDHAPAWSPSGRRVAFSRLHCVESDIDYAPPDCVSRGIYTIGRDGNDERLVVEDGLEPAWSRTGTIAFVRSSKPYPLGGVSPGEGGIQVLPGTGGAPRQIANRGFSPDWSPLGDRLVFLRQTGRNKALFVVNADGSGLRRLHVTGDDLASPVWAPDGRTIAFLENYVAFTISPTGRNRRRLLRFPCPCDTEGGFGLAWQSRRPAG